MKKVAITIVTLAAFGLGSATPAASQTILDNIVKRLIKPSDTAQTTSARSNNAAPITAGQTAAIDQLLTSAMQDPAIAADRSEAAELIKAIVATGSCAKSDGAWYPLSRKMVRPYSFNPRQGLYSPMSEFRYHEKDRCLDVVRMTDWNKPTTNVVAFRVYYVSPQSGEASSQKYALQKDSQNGWLIQDIQWRQ